MSDADEITKRDLAMMVKIYKQDDITPQTQMAANMIGTVWEAVGADATDPELSEAEADEILSQFPYDGDIETGEWRVDVEDDP